MDLAAFLQSSPTPLARAVLLTMDALRVEASWSCCAADGSPLSADTLFAQSPTAEAHFTRPDGPHVRVKWVPMDEKHVVLLAQRLGPDGNGPPIDLPLRIDGGPFPSALARGAATWTPESAADAVDDVRPFLRAELLDRLDPRRGETPAAGVPTAGGALFGGVVPRAPGFRYGDGDLLPGGSLTAGGMTLDARAFQPGWRGAESHSRYDPIFPGDARPLLRGEPSPDHLRPPGGPEFGVGSAFGPTRGGFGAMGPGGGRFGC